MKKSQSKDTTEKIILSLVLLFLGEGLFGFGLYWPVLLSLGLSSKNSYWYGLVFGVLVSAVTKTSLGWASLIIVLALFIFDRVREKIRANIILVFIIVCVLNLVTDKILGQSWGIFELLANGLVTMILFRLEFFNDDLHLSN